MLEAINIENRKTNMIDWNNFIGKEFEGKRSGRYKVIDYTSYSGQLKEWDRHEALYIQSLSSKGNKKFPLMIDVLLLMKKHFKCSHNMDEAFNSFCKENKIPKLPSQYTVESYYISFYNCFLSADLKTKLELNDDKQGFVSGEEGNPTRVYSTKYERDFKLRKQAIEFHGTSCKGCGFNFGKFYGDYGNGFIHIHHIIPISEYGGSKEVNPEKDLVPLCANCHSIIHRRKDRTLSIEELKHIIKKNF